jgi:hypothetical protein
MYYFQTCSFNFESHDAQLITLQIRNTHSTVTNNFLILNKYEYSPYQKLFKNFVVLNEVLHFIKQLISYTMGFLMNLVSNLDRGTNYYNVSQIFLGTDIKCTPLNYLML